MRVYKNKYKYHWISPYTIVEYMFFWTNWSKCGRSKDYIPNGEWVNPPDWYEKLAKFIEPVSIGIQWVLDKIDPKVDYVRIDPWDTWSMDSTLSPIILPMLKQLQATKHGAPFVVDEDVPEELKSTSAPPKKEEWDTDDNHFKRWDYVLNEMIFAFEKLNDDDWEEPFFAKGFDKEEWEKVNNRINNGLRLFGVYYRSLWD